MKVVSHKVVQSAGKDDYEVRGIWKDRFQRPVSVAVVVNKEEIPAESTLLRGDKKEVFDTLGGLAEMAWTMGWRPEGLPQSVAAYVVGYKLPPKVG